MRTPPTAAVTDSMLVNAMTLGIDLVSAEVLRAFGDAGVESILLKGPTLRRELYGDRPRPYSDTDLLVAPAGLDRAGAVLTALGFSLAVDHRRHAVVEPHAQEWTRDEPIRVVDLHWRIPGVRLDAAQAWAVLSARTQPFALADAPARSLDRTGIALLVALHAANPASGSGLAASDLALAIERFDRETWDAAARLADRLDAREAMAAGLGTAPGGPQLARALLLPQARSRKLRLSAARAAPGAHGLLRLA
ncbi:MAG TPA: nucleotidyltransferase family protein, partial [Solirubrobacteraceae bacterium]|nr:nucleotidyltransferase family protein [Solirubrobacteraceae bacterium]